MIRIINKIPRNVTIACSGGIDSMAATHFLLRGRRKINLAYFNHDTFHSYKAQEFVENYANQQKLNLLIGRVKGFKGRKSLEEFWRDERYAFFSRIKSDFIITCHHLDDCVETWLMSSIHGKSKLIPYHRAPNIYRPFLMTSKKTIINYAEKKGVAWLEDPSNKCTNFMRNHIRHKVIPEALIVNPGMRNTIRKKLIETYS